VTVKRVPHGRGSGWFHEHVKAGARLRAMAPLGRFVLHDSPLPLLLFAGGSGITPVIGLIKSALATTTRRIRLLYANRDARSVIFAAELEAWRSATAALRVITTSTTRRGFLENGAVRRRRGAAYLCARPRAGGAGRGGHPARAHPHRR
jgi:3-ketosteroid 9alpha-monooxygenase subunit B